MAALVIMLDGNTHDVAPYKQPRFSAAEVVFFLETTEIKATEHDTLLLLSSAADSAPINAAASALAGDLIRGHALLLPPAWLPQNAP